MTNDADAPPSRHIADGALCSLHASFALLILSNLLVRIDFRNTTMTILSQVEHNEIRQAFELFDVEGKGKIDAKELEQVMESLHMNDAAVAPFREALSKYKGPLDFATFERLVLSKRSKNNDWRYVFELFDTENKGYITKENLESVAKSLGENLTSEELEEMIERACRNKNGKVTFQEFVAIMTKNLFSSS